jgi:hypothetical protein
VALRLSRLLRACAAYGVFREAPPGSGAWANTPASSFLRAEHPATLRPAALNFGRTQFAMMERLPEAIVGGGASFAAVHGEEFWRWYGAHPGEHAVFDATMAALGRLGAADAAIAADVPWGAVADVVVDVGGGQGEMAAAVLTGCAQPPAAAVIFDMPHVVERSRAVWDGAGDGGSAQLRALIAARPALRAAVSHAGGDMFDSTTVPPPAGGRRYAYMLRDILHDWPDEDCVRILASLREAWGGGAGARAHRVMIVGRVLAPGAGFIKSLGTTDADVLMMGAFGTTAGERTREHYERLLAEAGLRLLKVTPTRSPYFVIEAGL